MNSVMQTQATFSFWGAVRKAALALIALVVAGGAWVGFHHQASQGPTNETPALAPALQTAQVARGAYLAQAGNCKGCHSPRGGPDYVGGVPIETPFGAVMSSNLTPDNSTGIGRWGNADFWRALHEGRSADGRLLYPAFPYEHFTHITRQDSDALWAFFKSLPAVSEPRSEHNLGFPYNTQWALAVWRALYFKPAAPWQEAPNQDAAWNRGAYLVEGLGHCAACHSERNALGAVPSGTQLAGGWMKPQGWWAPSLRWGQASGAAGPNTPEQTAEQTAERVRLLQTGVSNHKALMGPMAQVVATSTQYLEAADVQAMVHYLQSRPALPDNTPAPVMAKAPASVMAQGQTIYKAHCAACHGEQGQGEPGVYPALAGNRGVTQAHAGNMLKAIQNGGYAPSTRLNPRPFGMPPFRQTLSDDEIAAVATFVRQSWGR